MEPIDPEALAAQAVEMHAAKCNCAQCVACTLAPLVGADEDTCFRAAEALGAGLGGLTETCGALTGGALILGLANSSGIAERTSKAATYHLVRQLVTAFREKNGSTLCPELKGTTTTHLLCTCNDCIRDAAYLTACILREQESARS
ncbi:MULTISPECIES: C-GCAxxG-C-C family protein [Gordonibacter]|uniref:C-GCAxxG-C-C family protein n=1 Tax=Gordonibacter faecis TaxID=3047475 RepID=A0ABT7DQJ1_9ACTN|nr:MULTISPECIES: C-GCAxxG-C-C family protein [unclassified Gordonibacter]MDJ1651820.1 C-GCAxxG-C-C family protein [Gordonibacter sp. KGMB12511]HIW75646.1 C-GCAxxG-C-C family protein [Candidatus Gordonibacter avicola]